MFAQLTALKESARQNECSNRINTMKYTVLSTSLFYLPFVLCLIFAAPEVSLAEGTAEDVKSGLPGGDRLTTQQESDYFVRFDCHQELSREQIQDEGNLLAKVDKSYAKAAVLSAQFIQKSYFVGLDIEEVSRGNVDFAKPGKMNWQYTFPEKQRFVSNGVVFWFYQPDLNQVTLSDFKQGFQSDLPVSFLLGVGELESSFELKRVCKGDGLYLLDLTPQKEEVSVSSLRLLVREKDFLPQGARILDIGGNETTIYLLNLELGKELPLNKFEFDMPRGVDIIDERQVP